MAQHSCIPIPSHPSPETAEAPGSARDFCAEQAPTLPETAGAQPEGGKGWLRILKSNRGALHRQNIMKCINLLLKELRPWESWSPIHDELIELWNHYRRLENQAVEKNRKRREREANKSAKLQAHQAACLPNPAAKAIPPILQLFLSRLPLRPFCSNNLDDGVKIKPRKTAITFCEIQPNPPALRQCFVLDVDHDRPLPDGHPKPNIIIRNPDSGHYHAIFMWKTPILVGPTGRQKVQDYYNDLCTAISHVYGGDLNYRGTLCHNPFHARWQIEILEDQPYDLSAFKPVLQTFKEQAASCRYQGDPNRSMAYAALGRNCRTWEVCRHYGYDLGPRADLYNLIRDKVDRYNMENNVPPLGERECHAIAKSITKHVMSPKRNAHLLSDEEWIAWVEHTHRPDVQARRGRASVEARRVGIQDKIRLVQTLSAQGKTIRAIAAEIGVSKSTVARCLSHEPISG